MRRVDVEVPASHDVIHQHAEMSIAGVHGIGFIGRASFVVGVRCAGWSDAPTTLEIFDSATHLVEGFQGAFAVLANVH